MQLTALRWVDPPRATMVQDLNENRLSKFETCLLLVKIMEDFLSDDVQFNWVQMFKDKAP